MNQWIHACYACSAGSGWVLSRSARNLPFLARKQHEGHELKSGIRNSGVDGEDFRAHRITFGIQV